jgi:hypothetical protein
MHLLESVSLTGLPLLIGSTQIGRAALPHYFSLGKTVAIVGKRPNTWRKTRRSAAFCRLPLAVSSTAAANNDLAINCCVIRTYIGELQPIT